MPRWLSLRVTTQIGHVTIDTIKMHIQPKFCRHMRHNVRTSTRQVSSKFATGPSVWASQSSNTSNSSSCHSDCQCQSFQQFNHCTTLLGLSQASSSPRVLLGAQAIFNLQVSHIQEHTSGDVIFLSETASYAKTPVREQNNLRKANIR